MGDMTTIQTCDRCGFSYRLSLLPHKCADWTKGKTTNIPKPEPVGESGAPERVYIRYYPATTLTEQLADGGLWHYEGGPGDIEYARAPSPDSIREKARQVVGRILAEVSVNEFRQAQNYDRRDRLASIIAAEFGAGENNS